MISYPYEKRKRKRKKNSSELVVYPLLKPSSRQDLILDRDQDRFCAEFWSSQAVRALLRGPIYLIWVAAACWPGYVHVVRSHGPEGGVPVFWFERYHRYGNL